MHLSCKSLEMGRIHLLGRKHHLIVQGTFVCFACFYVAKIFCFRFVLSIPLRIIGPLQTLHIKLYNTTVMLIINFL